MTIEELRDKYSTLEKEHNDLKVKYDEQVNQNAIDKKRAEELEAYNRKLFNDYVLSKNDYVLSKYEPKQNDTENDENQLDNIINKMKENYNK